MEKPLLVLCGLFLAFQAGVGFLFGQVFAGHLSLAATLTGLAGVATAAGAMVLATRPGPAPGWVRWAALLGILGVGLDVVSYYRVLAIAGNYYPWALVGPYALGLAWVGRVAHVRARG